MIQLSSILFLVSTVSAHSIFQELYVNGADQGHLNGIRVPDYDGPITDVTSNDVICNGGINPYHTPISTTVIPVAAGTQVTAEWHHTLAGLMPPSIERHADGRHRTWVVQIWEDGFADGAWGVDRLITNKGKVSFTIPSCIAAGQYILRVELIALHGASSYPVLNFTFMECAQLQITGGGSTSPSTVSFPGAYKGSDPGITINIYYPTRTASSTAAVSTVQASSTSAASTPAATGTVAQYGQCGGLTYTGPTTCIAPFTCVKSSDYYSQCL
ncbi:hypothetical protein BDZ89DRAFT_1088925 [Hymenopellis radicata]|nr:hypothetical protein BDZ89DRAFT_1088925 [Hymenopellis radicata]